MSEFDYGKFLSADEQTQRAMIAERTGLYTSKDLSTGKFQHVWGFLILAFELRGKVDKYKYARCLLKICSIEDDTGILGDALEAIVATPLEMIAASLMAWPEKELKNGR